jgi:hypothetical protein
MNWKMTGDDEIDDWGAFTDKEEDLTLGYSMLRALAEAGEPMVEVGPGVWRDSGQGVTWVPKQDM